MLLTIMSVQVSNACEVKENDPIGGFGELESSYSHMTWEGMEQQISQDLLLTSSMEPEDIEFWCYKHNNASGNGIYCSLGNGSGSDCSIVIMIGDDRYVAKRDFKLTKEELQVSLAYEPQDFYWWCNNHCMEGSMNYCSGRWQIGGDCNMTLEFLIEP